MIDASELPVVVGLAVLGVGLAGIGTAIGVTAPADGPASEFAFEGEKLTYSDGETKVTVLNGTSRVETVEFESTAVGVEVAVEERDPLSESERDRAREIALANETVRQRLANVDDYAVSVEPIRQTDTERSVSIGVDGTESANDSVGSVETDGNTTAFTVDYDEENDSVVADRAEPSYVPGEASVEFDYGDESFSVVVDIDSGTVKHVFA